MTEAKLRNKVVNVMKSWLGLKESNNSHMKIIKKYNEHKPLPRNYAVKSTDEWCATTVSAAFIETGLTEIMVLECSCGNLVSLAKEKGIWQEKDGYVPGVGDVVLYDWQDNGKGDNTGWPDHVGIVEKVVGSTITIIEGNNGEKVARRNIKVNGRYIRGYITPNYESIATIEKETNTVAKKDDELEVGDTVTFTGNKHYKSSYVGAKAEKCIKGKAKITAFKKGAKHPYHLVAVKGKGSTVHGWVDSKDIKEAEKQSKAIKVGDTVEFIGKKHFTSSFKAAKSSSCKGGKAKVTAINKGKAHPYHLKSAEKTCTVHGWVDADEVKK